VTVSIDAPVETIVDDILRKLFREPANRGVQRKTST